MAEFFAMNGYGAYVWPSYGLSALVLGGLAARSILRRRRMKDEVERLERRLKDGAS